MHNVFDIWTWITSLCTYASPILNFSFTELVSLKNYTADFF